MANVVVGVGDAEDPVFGDGEFDAVLSGFVLRQLPDPAAALRSYRRILRPGGRLGVSYYASGFAGEWAAVADALEPFTGSGPDARSPERADPSNAEPRTAEARTAGPRTTGLSADEPRTAGSRTAGSRTAGSRTAGSRMAAPGTGGPPAIEPSVDELDSVSGLSALLGRAGFGSVDVTDEAHVIELVDVDRWWEYLWHSGYRGTMKRIPFARRDDAREAATEAARGLAESDGRVLMRVLVRRALATRPAGDAG